MNNSQGSDILKQYINLSITTVITRKVSNLIGSLYSSINEAWIVKSRSYSYQIVTKMLQQFSNSFSSNK